MLFFALALWSAARSWDVLFVVAALGMFLSKETFPLAAPALVAFRFLTLALTGERPRWRSSATLSSIVVLLLAAAVGGTSFDAAARAGLTSYGGRYVDLPDPISYGRFIIHNTAIIAFAGMCWLIPFGLWPWLRSRHVPRAWSVALLMTTVAGLLVVPQVLLYSRLGVIEGKYEAPAAVGVAGWVIGALAWLGASRFVTWHRTGLVVCGVSVALFGLSTWTYANAFAEDSLQLNRLVNDVATLTPPGGVIAIAADPAGHYEPILSLVDHVAHAGRPDIQVKVLPVQADTYTTDQARLAQTLLAGRVGQPPTPAELGCDRVSAVIVLTDLAPAESAMPCLATAYRRIDHSSNVLLWGGSGVSLRPRLPGQSLVSYTLLLPRPDA
jgi:hypothetical protein